MDILEHREKLIKSDKPSDVIKEVYKVFSHDENKHVGFDYTDRIITEFKRSPINVNENEYIRLLHKVMYVNTVVHYSIFKESALLEIDGLVEEKIAQEFRMHNTNGTLCMYASVLLYKLLISDTQLESFNEQTLKYVQGYYQHKVRERTLLRMLVPQSLAVHAFLTFDDTIVDATINQIEENYDEQALYFAIGDKGGTPDENRWFGIVENQSTIDAYIQDFIEAHGYENKEQWIEKHNDSIYSVLTKLSEFIS
ncbi:hypothetical protein CON15_19145 [Bacillus cereus]|uniref:Uncharacterized protein n=1 Tax=Bacillus thuringiensis TaxID=1428 RepID=A0AB36VFH8_BACTU|nr:MULTISPECIES: hypothetical protein [Bacillus cereus group]PDZ55658.1 hypothetical protein CON15_19145 [Bacillus cereus]PFC28437.1 hypothetical protein CN299_19385 [Bacillus thuringiensis]PFO26266.1 hypothetical protein COJ78_29630 [Bacillus thuringiensis]PFS40278.1 hypothetical protein COK48_00100 [Bacillus thuringiensis]PFS58265.1 hypothetical protein COK64_17955 [Bacillus thuringiensis]